MRRSNCLHPDDILEISDLEHTWAHELLLVCKTSQATENFLNQLDIFFPWKSWWTCGVIVCRSLYHYEYVLVYWYLNYVSYISFGVLRKGFFLLYLSSFVSKQKYTMSWKDKKECCFDVNCQIHIRSFNLIVVFI